MDDSILKELTDEEISTIYRDVPVTVLLDPIQHQNTKYKAYLPRLGRLTPNSTGVRNFIHDTAVKLYRRNDMTYVSLFEKAVSGVTNDLLEVVKDYVGEGITEDDLKTFSTDQWIEWLKDHKKNSSNPINYDLFWVQLKLIGKSLTEEEKERILAEVEKTDSLDDGASTDFDSSEKENEQSPEESQDYDQDVTALKNEDKESLEHNKAVDTVVQDKTAEMPDDQNEIKEQPQFEWRSKKKNKRDERNDGMTTYVGRIELRNNYYNFTPVAEVDGKEFVQLSENDIDYLLPESEKRNINLSFSFYSDEQSRFMQRHFYNDQMILFTFETSELQENIASNGFRNPTGYKVNAQENVKNGRIRYLSDDGFYSLKDESVLGGRLEERAVEISYDGVVDGEKILVNLGGGFYAGPYTVRYSERDNRYYIRTDIVENKYLIRGYSSENCVQKSIDTNYGDASFWYDRDSVKVYYVSEPDKYIYKDVITDEQLLEELQHSLQVPDVLEAMLMHLSIVQKNRSFRPKPFLKK